MGKGIGGDWNKQPENWQRPEDFIPYFRAQCFQLDQCLFGLGATLYQMGPPPGAYTTYFNNPSIFPNNPYIPTGDYYSSSTKSSDLFAPLRKSKKKSSAETAEEKIAKAKEKADKDKLVEKYKNIYNILEKYKETLNDNTDPSKSEYEAVLKDYKSSAPTSSQTKDQIEGKISDIIALYDSYNGNENKIRDAYKTYVTNNLTSATGNQKHITAVTSLSNWINNPIEDNFGGILEKNSDGIIVWAEEDDAPKYDIMELLSAWNSNSSTSGKHIIKTIIDKCNELNNNNENNNNGEMISNLETLAKALCEKLRDRAGEVLKNKDKLSNETKKDLDNAKSRFPNTISDLAKATNLSQQFDNLYHAIRIAEAELADKDLKEKFAFLDTNPYASHSEFITQAQTDLDSERFVVQTSSGNTGNEARVVLEGDIKSSWNGKKVTIEDDDYTINYSDGSISFISSQSGGALDENELGISSFKMNNDFSYSYIKDGVEKKYDKDCEIVGSNSNSTNKTNNTNENNNNSKVTDPNDWSTKYVKINDDNYEVFMDGNNLMFKNSGGAILSDEELCITDFTMYKNGNYSYIQNQKTLNFDKDGKKLDNAQQ